MPSTSPHGFRYPLDTDPANDGAEAVRNLANDVDDRIGAIAAGADSVALVAANNGTKAITFPAGRFASAPRVVAVATGTSAYVMGVNSITTAGCNVTVRQINDVTATTSIAFHWIAVDQS